MNTPVLISNRYKLGPVIGRGGMGTVYEGQDVNTQTAVAIKALNPDLVEGNPHLLARFIREGEVLRQLNHPNIVKLLDAAEHGGIHYLVMEHVQGGDLQAWLEQEQTTSIDATLSIALDLCDALTRAHRLGIIHRDLKPANVLLAADGTPRLADFGLAYDGRAKSLTATGAIMGTLAYLSPEACLGEKLDGRTDIWALGVILYELLTGRRPFEGDSVGAIIHDIINTDFDDLSAFRSDVPESLQELLFRMLIKNPLDRISSMRLVGAELEAILKRDEPEREAWTLPPPSENDEDRTALAIFSSEPEVNAPNNLPYQATPFVGRVAEIAALSGLLNEQGRLITILGPGGMGKTRLSLAFGKSLLEETSLSFSDGVFFVPLAPVVDPAQLSAVIAENVGFQFGVDSRDQETQLISFLSSRKMFLILDNFEHLIVGSKLVSRILAETKEVKLLVTSRVRLNLSAEAVYSLQGLAFDHEVEVKSNSAVELFRLSARRVQIDFAIDQENLPHVLEICQLVQGLPLAILLAASWINLMPLEEIAQELSQDIDFLETEMEDLPARQRSMRAVFNYSWERLPEKEKQYFVELSVFRGGFTRQAARAVTGANIRSLSKLLNASFIGYDHSLDRYQIHELLRQFGADILEQDDHHFEAISQKTSVYFSEYLYQQGERLKGAHELESVQLILRDLNNGRVAWNWAIKAERYDILLKFQFVWFKILLQWEALYEELGHLLELLTDIVKQQSTHTATQLHFWVMVCKSRLLTQLGDAKQSLIYVERALSLLDSLPLSDTRNWLYKYMTMGQLGPNLSLRRGTDNARKTKELIEETIAYHKQNEDPFSLGESLVALAMFYRFNKKYSLAIDTLENAIDLFESVGVTTAKIRAETELTYLIALRNEFTRAEELMRDAISSLKKIGRFLDLGEAYNGLAQTFFMSGKFDQAKESYRQAYDTFSDFGFSVHAKGQRYHVGKAALHAGQYSASLEWLNQNGNSGHKLVLARAYWVLGDHELAMTLQEEGLNEARPLAGWIWFPELCAGCAIGYMHIGDSLEAKNLIIESLEGAVRDKNWYSSAALSGAAMFLTQQGYLNYGIEVYAAACSHPHLRNSQWHADTVGRFIDEKTNSLAPEIIEQAQQRGRVKDLDRLHDKAAELLEFLKVM